MNASTDTADTKQVSNALLTDAEIAAVQDILMDQLDVTRAQVTPAAGIEADLMADSLDNVEIVMRMEERFNVTIADDDAEPVKTVEDLYETLAKVLRR
ncbi:MAG TPA: acyl carrier protein [Verrucomicrobiae bacterium]